MTRLVGDSARDSGELMEDSGNSARDSGELRGELRDSGDSDHPFWRTQEGTQGAPPLGAMHQLRIKVSAKLRSILDMILYRKA